MATRGKPTPEDGLKLHSRTTRFGDLQQCVVLMGDGFLYHESAKHRVCDMWQAIISRDVGRSAVVFADRDPRRILAFGVSGAIDDACFETIKTGGLGFVGRRFLDEWCAGHAPFLNEAEFALANAGAGINMLVLHNGIVATTDETLASHLWSLLAESFIVQHAGLNLKSFAHEAFSLPAQFAADLGFNVRLDHPIYDIGELKALSGRRPFIASMTRADAAISPGNLALNQTFLRFNRPFLGLTETERSLLRFALEGEPDHIIAATLSIAPATLKKHWARIYQKAGHVVEVSIGGESGHRGAEARRHVLHYVRQHREELHAYRPT